MKSLLTWKKILVGVALVAAILLLPQILPTHPLQLVTESLVISVTAMSFVFLYGYVGLTSMAQMAYFAVAGYTVAIFTVDHGGSFWLGALLGIAFSTLVSLLFGLIAYRSSGIFFLMMTLALGQLAYSVSTQWSSVTRGYTGFSGVPRPKIGSFDLALLHPRYFLFVLITLLMLALLSLVIRSQFGLGARAVSENPIKAEALGINVNMQRLGAHVIAGAAAGVAGVMGIIQYGVVSPETTGLNDVLKVVMAAIIGGALWLSGGIIGSVVVVLLISFASGLTERYWMIVGTLFVLVVIFFPDGILGAVNSIKEKWKMRRGTGPEPAAGSMTEIDQDQDSILDDHDSALTLNQPS